MRNKKTKSWLSFNFRDVLYNNKIILVFSFVAALVLWLVITITQNPTIEKSISGVAVTISTQNTVVSELGLDIVNDDFAKEATVRVSGPSYIISSLVPGDLQVTASLSQVNAAGTYDLELVATKSNNKIGYTILSVEPSVISVTFDTVETKEFDVVAVANGASATQGLIAEDAVVTESDSAKIEITGPSREISRIAKVHAVADVNKVLSQTESFAAKLVLLDENDKEIDASIFNLEFEEINISVPVYKKKEVPIRPVFTNLPEYFVKNGVPCTLNVKTVTVLGAEETINTVDFVQLAPIDFSNVSLNNTKFDVDLQLSTALKTVENYEYVTVEIDLSGYSEKNFSVTQFEPIGLAEGLKIDLPASIKQVKVCGPSEAVYGLSGSQLSAKIDLTGKAEGEYTVNAIIYAKSTNKVWAVGSYTVVVTIR
ncbi:MAG: CdaR family protein [bacterium]|nr:CdaR family protein [bacterium]